jgi:hypothetical protein
MSTIKVAKSIGVMLTLVIALSTAMVTSAAAQGRDDRSNRWNRGHLTRYAFALGYTRGYQDAGDRSHRSYREIQRWREGTEGWEDPMGTRNTFRDNFRRGFARGFMDARSGRSARYSQGDVDRMRSESDEPHRRR